MAGLRDWRRRKPGERTREIVREETRVDLAEGDRERIAALEDEVDRLIEAVHALRNRPEVVPPPAPQPPPVPVPVRDERMRQIIRALLAERDGAQGGEHFITWNGVDMDVDTFLDAMRDELTEEMGQ